MTSKLFVTVAVVAFILVLAVAGAIRFLHHPNTWILERVARRKMKAAQLSLVDGLHAILTGTGAPMPDRRRAGPSTAVRAGDKLFVVDAGDGSTRNLQLAGLKAGMVEAAFLTHFHSDHIGGLGELMLQRWAAGGNGLPLPVYGPKGTGQVVEGFRLAYTQDTGYRVAHHGADTLPPAGAGGRAIEFDLGLDPMASQVVYEQDGVTITAFNVDHAPVIPAVGYKFAYKGRSLVISGDTAYSDNLVAQATHVDLLVCEALNQQLIRVLNRNAALAGGPTLKKITADIETYHMTPEQAAETASKSSVACLILSHILPPLPSPILTQVFLGDAKKIFHGKLTIGRDGLLVSLPASRKTMQTRYLFGR